MTREELKAIVKYLTAEYKGFEMDNYRFAIWYDDLKVFTAEQVQTVVKTYTRANHRPPLIADIFLPLVQTDDNEGEAWAQVLKAIKNSTYHSKEEYAKLPLAAQKAIGSPDVLKELAQSTDLNLSVESSNFKRAYRTAIEREKQTLLIDSKVKERLQLK